MPIEDDPGLRRILERDRHIAVLGIKNGPGDDAWRIPAYMQQQGYTVVGINPKLDEVLGAPCVPRLADLAEAPDMIDVFRASEHIAGHVEEILALPVLPRSVWLQLGIRDDASATRLEARGIEVVQDRCLLVEHRRLLAPGGSAG